MLVVIVLRLMPSSGACTLMVSFLGSTDVYVTVIETCNSYYLLFFSELFVLITPKQW